MREVENNIQENFNTVAYVLKGFPRLSEMFIASEIYRLEQAGLRLRLYVIRQPDEVKHHEVVERIRARPDYLPPVTTLSGVPLLSWLLQNLRPFLRGLIRCLRRRPAGLLQGAAAAFAQALRSRRNCWGWPRKVYVKEFLLATALADRLFVATDVRHLHAHFCHGATTVSWLASIITGVPFSFTAHAKDVYCESLNPAGLLRRKMDAARFVVTCTGANQQYLQKLSQTRVHCIYHGLNADFTRLLQERNEEHNKNGHFQLLAVGRLVPKKGFDVFVDACAILKRRGVSFDAIIAGESGEHEAEIKRRISNCQLNDQIRLIGPISQSQLLEYYNRATALCLPCRVLDNGDRDGIPNVLMEAMACGLPVISTNISGIPEIVTDNVNGLLVPPDNAGALANSILRIYREKPLAQRLSHQGRRTVQQRFDGEEFALQLADLFREVRP